MTVTKGEILSLGEWAKATDIVNRNWYRLQGKRDDFKKHLIEDIAAALTGSAQVRNEALEEAAKLCEAVGCDWGNTYSNEKESAADYLAVGIRALQSGEKGK